MIKYKQGNLLEADVEALVNTVNCVGVMGKGIALQFKQAFPENFTEYANACKAGKVFVGNMFVFKTGKLFNPKYIINFPTKRHWKGKSKIEDIEIGLKALAKQVEQLEIKSIAIPPLGSGLGGLSWNDVKTRILQTFEQMDQVEVWLYEPIGSPAADKIKIATTKPKMTNGRALLIKALDLYGGQGYRRSKLEVQKLMYFVQEAGEPLKLRYEKQQYGPYADNLNHVLQRIDGHYIKGFGDRSTKSEIYLTPNALKEANDYLEKHKDASETLNRVSRLIDRFETPYGLELLSTVHWIVTKSSLCTCDPDSIIDQIKKWNSRKNKIMKPAHVKKALLRLQEENWIECKCVSA